MYPLLYRSVAAAAKYSTQQFQRQTAACVTCKWSLWEANVSVSSMGGIPCSFARLSRSLLQPLQLDMSQKMAKTVYLKLSKNHDKNAFYNYVNSSLDSA